MPRLNMKKLLPAGLLVDHVGFDRRQIEISARAAKGWAVCPECGARSGRVHSRYRRRLADLPALGFDVRLLVQVRRFCCCSSGRCCRAIFAERLDPGISRLFRLGSAQQGRMTGLGKPHCSIQNATTGGNGRGVSMVDLKVSAGHAVPPHGGLEPIPTYAATYMNDHET